MELIDYQVEQAGWATFQVWTADRGEVSNFGVSYLHDSLADLARLALALNAGQTSATAVFMEEPGEVNFVVQGENDSLSFELRNFADWASWGMVDPCAYTVWARGHVSRAELVRNIQKVLERIYTTVGFARYRELWVEHDFPIAEYEQLSAELGRRIRDASEMNTEEK